MDDQNSQVLSDLVRHSLPDLHKALKAVLKLAAEDRSEDSDLLAMLTTVVGQLNEMVVFNGGAPQLTNDHDQDEEMDDAEASALLAEVADDDLAMIEAMESDRGAIGDPVGDDFGSDGADAMTSESAAMANDSDEMVDDSDEMVDDSDEMVDDSADFDNIGGTAEDGELSDEEAAMLLGEEGASAPASDTADEAARLLADLPEDDDDQSDSADEEGGLILSDASDDMSDDEARALLAQMDGEDAAGETSAGGDMSDDEARALLAQMDGEDSGSSGGESSEMSDDEARALLAQMDGGSAESESADEEMSADDEAAALLAQLGGEDDDEDYDESAELEVVADQAPAAAPQPTASVGAAEGLSEEIGEIPEWSPNDFQTDPDMVSDFNENSGEIMDVLDDQILQLEANPESSEIIEEIFRAAHTLKGAAGMFGFTGLERVMHRMENLFDLIRKGKMKPSSDIIDVMFGGLDVIRDLLEAVKDGKPCGIKTAPIVTNLSLLAEGKAIPGKAPAAISTKGDEVETGTHDAVADGGDKPGKKADKEKAKEISTIRVDLNRLDVLVNLVGELVIDRTRFVTIEEELRTKYPEVKLSGNISETVQLFGRHMNEIQDIIMKVRMVPIGNAFNKYPRIVRDLAKQLGKKIDLLISGESAELDKTLVEQIGDPLIHLIRNSCDHGIEAPEVRQAAGKNPAGAIFLSAHQEGNHIIITIEDDGKGIPVDIIRRKGIEKGLIGEEDKLSNREIFNLIFEPGFSTAEQITNVSGRGVGMDVVKKQIMKLKGMLEIDSEEGRGTTITIRLPLTLAIVQSLLIKASDETFAIPLGSVIESIRISPDEIQKVGDNEVIKLRDKVLPLMHLDDELHLENKKHSLVRYIDHTDGRGHPRKNDRLFVVVVGSPDRPFGILVDQLLNQQEMVIKSMGRLMQGISGVAGGAVLGNGEVVLVLDIAELEQSFRNKNRNQKAA